jgi:hypothetical protein
VLLKKSHTHKLDYGKKKQYNGKNLTLYSINKKFSKSMVKRLLTFLLLCLLLFVLSNTIARASSTVPLASFPDQSPSFSLVAIAGY